MPNLKITPPQCTARTHPKLMKKIVFIALAGFLIFTGIPVAKDNFSQLENELAKKITCE
jgi:hypothetical protein